MFVNYGNESTRMSVVIKQRKEIVEWFKANGPNNCKQLYSAVNISLKKIRPTLNFLYENKYLNRYKSGKGNTYIYIYVNDYEAADEDVKVDYNVLYSCFYNMVKSDSIQSQTV